jgi:hypothetical protein
VLTGGLDKAALARLDGLLTARLAGKLTWLGWLRNAPQSPAPGNVGKLLERLAHVRSLWSKLEYASYSFSRRSQGIPQLGHGLCCRRPRLYPAA